MWPCDLVWANDKKKKSTWGFWEDFSFLPETCWELTDITFDHVECSLTHWRHMQSWDSHPGTVMAWACGRKASTLRVKNRKIKRSRRTQLCCHSQATSERVALFKPLLQSSSILADECGLPVLGWRMVVRNKNVGMTLERTKGLGSQKPREWADGSIPLAIFLLEFSHSFPTLNTSLKNKRFSLIFIFFVERGGWRR